MLDGADRLFFESLFESKSVILGGMKVIQENVLSKPGELQRYQQGTYVVGCMAFVGSYVYMLSRLLDRTANNDLYPLSLHYYAARILIACLVARGVPPLRECNGCRLDGAAHPCRLRDGHSA
jgi:hypothetical protein